MRNLAIKKSVEEQKINNIIFLRGLSYANYSGELKIGGGMDSVVYGVDNSYFRMMNFIDGKVLIESYREGVHKRILNDKEIISNTVPDFFKNKNLFYSPFNFIDTNDSCTFLKQNNKIICNCLYESSSETYVIDDSLKYISERVSTYFDLEYESRTQYSSYKEFEGFFFPTLITTENKHFTATIELLDVIFIRGEQ